MVGRIDENGQALLTTKEAVDFLAVTRRTISRLIQRGVLEVVRLPKGRERRMLTLDSLEAYKMQKGCSVHDLAKRVLELERKMAWVMSTREAKSEDTQYKDVMSELKKHHPEFYS